MRDCWVLVAGGFRARGTHTARSGRRAGVPATRASLSLSMGGILS